MATPEKVSTVKTLADSFRSATAVYVTDYRGLTVPQLKQLRTGLRGNASFVIAKNTLTALAAKDAGIEGLDSLFYGPTAIAFVTGDPVEAAKALRDFSKSNDKLVIKGGAYAGKALTVDGIKALAAIPSREVLIAQVAGLLKSPIQRMAVVLTWEPPWSPDRMSAHSRRFMGW